MEQSLHIFSHCLQMLISLLCVYFAQVNTPVVNVESTLPSHVGWIKQLQGIGGPNHAPATLYSYQRQDTNKDQMSGVRRRCEEAVRCGS